MEEVNLILAALLAGSQIGAQEVVAESIKDAYASLKALLSRHFTNRPEAQTALAQYENKPEVWEAPLKAAITETEARKEEAIVKSSEALLELIKQNYPKMSQQSVAGLVGQINAPHGKVAVIGGNVDKIDM